MLAVVHNVTALTRLIDVLAVLDTDPRVQIVFTVTGSSPFDDGIAERLTALGCISMPWEQAIAQRFDLAISASLGGDLHHIDGPLVIVPHGLGYNKYLAAGEPGSRGAVFGLSPEWLLHDGRPFASTIVLSHDEQLARLRDYCPEALDTAEVAGDPCLDRLQASRHLRERYRHAFGLARDRRLVVLSSTWGANSLYGQNPDLPVRVAHDLPIDRYQVAVALHPNVWHAHSPWQVNRWLAACRDAGVLVLSPWEQWRAALVAADVVIGDFGSVTMYAAAIGRPVLIAATDHDGLDPASPVARFTAAAPHLDTEQSLAAQLEAVIREPRQLDYAAILAEATSVPGRSVALLRQIFYRWLDLAEPATEAVTPVVAIPADRETRAAAPNSVIVGTRADVAARSLTMVRFPAKQRLTDPPPGDSHLLADWTSDDPGPLSLADVLVCRPGDTFEPAETWIRRTLKDFRGCLIAAVVGDRPDCVAGVRGGPTIRLYADRHVPGTVLASAMHGWLAAGQDPATIDGVTVHLGGDAVVTVRLRPVADGPAVPRQLPRSAPSVRRTT